MASFSEFVKGSSLTTQGVIYSGIAIGFLFIDWGSFLNPVILLIINVLITIGNLLLGFMRFIVTFLIEILNFVMTLILTPLNSILALIDFFMAGTLPGTSPYITIIIPFPTLPSPVALETTGPLPTGNLITFLGIPTPL